MWTWICLGLTIVSWLYSPFIFNPYMFQAEAFYKDVRAWWGFFFVQDGGMQWVDWYENKQIMRKKGLSRSPVDLHLLLGFFGLLVIVSTLQDKLRLLTIVSTSEVVDVKALQFMSLAPPVGLSFAYCLVSAILGGACRRSDDYKPTGTTSGDLSGSVDGDEGPCCRPPLCVSALIVGLLFVIESLAPL